MPHNQKQHTIQSETVPGAILLIPFEIHLSCQLSFLPEVYGPATEVGKRNIIQNRKILQ